MSRTYRVFSVQWEGIMIAEVMATYFDPVMDKMLIEITEAKLKEYRRN